MLLITFILLEKAIDLLEKQMKYMQYIVVIGPILSKVLENTLFLILLNMFPYNMECCSCCSVQCLSPYPYRSHSLTLRSSKFVDSIP